MQVRILPRAPFRPASIKVMQRTFNPLNRERYPGGPPLPGRLISRTSPFEGERAGANPAPAANHSPLAQNQSGSLTNCGRWRVTSTGYQLPLSVEVCTPVSETGRVGALPAAAANLRRTNKWFRPTAASTPRASARREALESPELPDELSDSRGAG